MPHWSCMLQVVICKNAAMDLSSEVFQVEEQSPQDPWSGLEGNVDASWHDGKGRQS